MQNQNWEQCEFQAGWVATFPGLGFLVLPFIEFCKTLLTHCLAHSRDELCQSISLQGQEASIKVYLQCANMQEPISKQR